MPRLARSVCVFAIFAVTGCAQNSAEGFGFVARQSTDFETQTTHYDVAGLVEQSFHLDALMRNVVDQSGRTTLSDKALSKSIFRTSDQMDTFMISLPRSLAAQDIALADLARRRDAGDVSDAAYLARLEEVRAGRRDLVQALALTQTQANAALENLNTAAADGQSGLDPHLRATRQLARTIGAARTQITMF